MDSIPIWTLFISPFTSRLSMLFIIESQINQKSPTNLFLSGLCNAYMAFVHVSGMTWDSLGYTNIEFVYQALLMYLSQSKQMFSTYFAQKYSHLSFFLSNLSFLKNTLFTIRIGWGQQRLTTRLEQPIVLLSTISWRTRIFSLSSRLQLAYTSFHNTPSTLSNFHFHSSLFSNGNTISYNNNYHVETCNFQGIGNFQSRDPNANVLLSLQSTDLATLYNSATNRYSSL